MENSPKYGLLGTQCTTWACQTLRNAGANLPNVKGPFDAGKMEGMQDIAPPTAPRIGKK